MLNKNWDAPLDKLLGLPPGASKAEVLAAMKGHVLDAVELMGRYARQSSVKSP